MNTSDLEFNPPFPFYKSYIDLLGEVELMDTLNRQLANFPKFLKSIPNDKLGYSYAMGKWTVLQALVHITDAERVFQYRALRFARGDKTPLPGFDQDLYVAGSVSQVWTKESLLHEYVAVRQSTITLFNSLDEKSLRLAGTASGLEWSVGKLGFVICGHQRHHRNILRERYL